MDAPGEEDADQDIDYAGMEVLSRGGSGIATSIVAQRNIEPGTAQADTRATSRARRLSSRVRAFTKNAATVGRQFVQNFMRCLLFGPCTTVICFGPCTIIRLLTWF